MPELNGKSLTVTAANDAAVGYAELHCLSNFSFLRGASHPEELVERACQLDYSALAITDECSVAGVVRALLEVKRQSKQGNPIKLIVGAEFRLTCGMRFIALAPSRQGYGRLCRLITRGRRVAEKGTYTLERLDVQALLSHCLILWLPGAQPECGRRPLARRALSGRCVARCRAVMRW